MRNNGVQYSFEFATLVISLFLLHTQDVQGENFSVAEQVNPPTLIEDFFFIESVTSQERGEVQLSLATGYFSGSPEGNSQLGQFGIEYGVTDRLQVEVNLDAWRDRETVDDGVRLSHSGIGDLEFGLKYAFPSSAARGFELAIGVEVTAPVGDADRDLGEGFWSYEPFVIVSRKFGAETELALGLSYGIRRLDDQVDDPAEIESATNELEFGLGLVRAFGPAWRGTLELSYETDEVSSRGNESEAYLAPGLVYAGSDSLQLGMALGAGLTTDSADWVFLGLLSYEF